MFDQQHICIAFALVISYYFVVRFRFHCSISIDHNPDGPATKLFIKSVQVQDEETYTCSVTYLDPSESCDSSGSYKIQLDVLGMCEQWPLNVF